MSATTTAEPTRRKYPADRKPFGAATGIGTEIFTTGQVARMCRVAPRTVSKWIDAGELKGYRIPLSVDRRVPRDVLIAFMRANKFPVPEALAPPRPAVAVLAPVAGCVTPLQAGLMLGRGEVGRLLVGCQCGLDTAVKLAREARAVAPTLPLAVVLPDDRSALDAPEELFGAVLFESDPAAVAAWLSAS